MADLSIIVVNYNSGWFLANMVESLLDQEILTPKGEKAELEIVVVDNNSPEDQHGLLDPLEQKGNIKIIYSKENTGYSGGNNLGMEHVSSDWLMITNPDVVFMPGSVQKMLEVLYQDQSVGQAGPRGWLDPAFHFLLPPVEMPTLYSHLYECAGRIFKTLGKSYSMRRSKIANRFWVGKEITPAEVISGFCFVMPMDLAKKLGPFDTGFPFYYEDNDLSLRVRQQGKKLVYVKDTRVLHFYNKSAGPVFEEALKKYYVSKSYFFKKHYGGLRHYLYRKSTDYLKKRIHKLNGAYFESPKDFGEIEAPFEIDLPENQQVVVEITLDPAFVLAAGHAHPGGTYSIPQRTWDALDATTWHLRVLDKTCEKKLGSYTWRKKSHALRPPSYTELMEDDS